MSEPLGVALPDTRQHPVYLVIGTAKTLRQAIPFLVVTIFGGAPWWVNAALFALVMVIAVAQWHVKKYSVVGGVLLLRGGLVNRSVQAVPVSRITALSASQSMSQRLIGVWGLNVQSAGEWHSSVVTLACLSGHRLDELRDALEPSDRTDPRTDSNPAPDLSPIGRYVAWRHTTVSATPSRGRQVVASLTTPEMLIAAATNSSIILIFVAALVVWSRFSAYLPARTSEFMNEVVEPQGFAAVLVTLALVAIVGGVAFGTLRFYRFTLIRDGDVLHTSRGLLGKQTATISVKRVQAVRIVEGPWRTLLGYCSLQVEVAGLGLTNSAQRMLFPLVRTNRAEALIRQALPELPWPSQPLHALPARARRRYLSLPLGYAAGFTLLMVFLPGWWAVLAALPLPLGYALGVTRAREARWRVDDQCVVLRWRRLLNRNMVVAHRVGAQVVELSTSRRKAKAGIAGFTMRFSSGRAAKIRYMVDSDALRLLHVGFRRRRADLRS
jgi:putative membrane protein